MKRSRNVITLTALLVVLVFLFSRRHSDTADTHHGPLQYDSVKATRTSSTALPLSTPVAPLLDEGLGKPLQPDTNPAAGFVPPSAPDVFVPPNLPPAAPISDLPEKFPPSDFESPPAEPPVFEAEFAFQQDLALDLPIDTLKQFSTDSPHNYQPHGPKTNAYATFMATRNPSLKDPYYMAIHSLIYRVLWSPHSKTEKYPFIVFVGDFVTAEQRELLAGAGAIVRELSPLPWNPDVPGVQHRWKDLFAKLNMWAETEFSLIHFLDADAFPVVNVDGIFEQATPQGCDMLKVELDDALGSSVCGEPYVFAGVPQDPFNETDVNVNVGSMVFAPSEKMHQRLLQNYVKTDRYNCLMAEQAFLNWQFNINGAFPARILEREWGGFFPSEEEQGKLRVVHEKLWMEERSWMKQEWLGRWQDMLNFYASADFAENRKRDGVS